VGGGLGWLKVDGILQAAKLARARGGTVVVRRAGRVTLHVETRDQAVERVAFLKVADQVPVGRLRNQAAFLSQVRTGEVPDGQRVEDRSQLEGSIGEVVRRRDALPACRFCQVAVRVGLARQLVCRLVELERVQLRLLAEYLTGRAGRACPSQLAELVLQLRSRHLADGARGSPQRPVGRGRR
jgi:hypothetical protein